MAPHHLEDSDTADTGYFPTTEQEDEDLEELAEPWHKYDKKINSSVFYPIQIGEVLDQRYRIEHKVSHGGCSTVWMAHDLRDKRDVALKIMISGEFGEHEYRIQNEILQDVKNTAHLVTYLRTFLLHGDGCDHRVLIFPLLGECLLSLNVEKKSMYTRMFAARQLLEAVESLHKAGIVHRDINERNCMWGVRSLDNLDRNDKYKTFGRPLKQSIPYIEALWKPGEIVKPLVFPENLRTETFFLGDFGLSMKRGTAVKQQGRPPMKFCSPDRLHHQEPSFSCDIWSYMCIFAELYFGLVPFSSWLKGGVVTPMVQLFGPLPKQWKGHYFDPEGSLDSWYDHDNKSKDPKARLTATIERLRPEADPVERQHVLSVLSWGFSMDPNKRPSATQLLRDPSFNAIIDRHCR